MSSIVLSPHTLVKRLHTREKHMSRSSKDQTNTLSTSSSGFFITYEEACIAALPGAKSTSAPARNLRTCVKKWCAHHEKTLRDGIGDEFGTAFEGHLRVLTEKMLAVNPTCRTSDNIRWAARKLFKTYHSLLLAGELPVDFLQALTVLRLRKGWAVAELVKAYQNGMEVTFPTAYSVINSWVQEKVAPSYRHDNSIRGIRALEKIFDVPEGTLSNRAFRKPIPILADGAQKNVYRDNHSKLTRSKYAQPMPLHIAETFEEHAAWQFKSTHRINEQSYVIDSGRYWTTDDTKLKYSHDVTAFFSYLMLPAPTKMFHKLTPDERMLLGKGLKPEELRYTMLLNMDLMWDFLEWKRHRQANQVFTQNSSHFLMFVNNMVNHPYSFVRAHSKFGIEQVTPVDAKDWEGYCDVWHEKVLRLARQIKKGIPSGQQRDPKIVLKTILSQKNTSPLKLLHELIHRMHADLASPLHPKKRAAEFRDALLFDLMLLEPLRASHWGGLELGKHLIQTKGSWELIIDKSEFKNKSSIWCQDRRTVFNSRVSGLIDQYLEQHRPHLHGGTEASNTRVFLSAKVGPGRHLLLGVHPYAITEATLWNAVANRFNTYFGIRIGTNVFRHLLCKAYLMEHSGDWDGAAAILNNSPDVARKTYGELSQDVHREKADVWRDKQEQTFQKEMANRGNARG